jgi:hypothetical protein
VTLTRAELIEIAAPPCPRCASPIVRTEMPWHLDEDGVWRLGPCHTVCSEGHRTLVEPLP